MCKGKKIRECGKEIFNTQTAWTCKNVSFDFKLLPEVPAYNLCYIPGRFYGNG